MSALSELLTQANADGWSFELIAQKAQQRGHQLSRDTAWRYMTGRQRETTEPYLRALADVLNVPFDDVRTAAGVPARLGPWSPPVEAETLNEREREAVETIIRSMARGKATATVTPLRSVEAHQSDEAGAPVVDPGSKAARKRRRPSSDPEQIS